MGKNAKTAADMIWRDIMNGTHSAGQQLRLSALSARYGIGAATLRKGLAQLEDMSLVVNANRGWRTASVSLAEFEDLLDARTTLETVMLAEAMERGTLEWEANLVAAHYRLAQAVRPLGAADTLAYRQTWIAVHDGFHVALLAGARSSWLKHFHAQLLTQLQRHHQAVMAQLHPVTEDQEPLLAQTFSVPRHTELMVAALDRDGAAAQTALAQHNELANAIFRRFLGNGHPEQ